MTTKEQVSDLLTLIATYLELRGENSFKIRAFQNAARTVSTLTGDLEDRIASGTLKEEKGIGNALFETIREFVQTGKSKVLEELQAAIPASLLEMLGIPGLGPKKIKVIYEKLGIASIGELEYACYENRLTTLPGFGSKTQDNILKGIESLKKGKDHFHFDKAWSEGSRVLETLRTSGLFSQIELAGSLRRKKEVIRDIDLVSCSNSPAEAIDFLTRMPDVESVTAHGETKGSVLLRSGMQVDLRVVSETEYPFALQHFTGSKEHNASLRGIAREQGYKLNEYGLFRGDQPVHCRTESEIYGALGFDYIPPELREDRDELTVAREHHLPKLVEFPEIRGIFHVHSTYSDGNGSLESMVRSAAEAGYEYIGISDHSRSAFYAHGLKEEDILRQHEEIDRLQKQWPRIRIFKGIESDILDDGSLDYSEETLDSFDFVIGSIHSRFKMNREEMTRRLVRAIENPYLTILGHMTGRLLLSRSPYQFDLDQVLDAAKKHGVVIELNANPHRFDIDWRDCWQIRNRGLQVSINPDAHAEDHIRFTELGVGIARKGWLTAKDVFNTRTRLEMEACLAARRPVH